jgi:tetratricopeptide (TPR) repeat protein
MNQTDAALADFQLAIGRDRNLGAAHTALGEIYRERGDTARAIAEFSEAIRTSPSADSYYQRGQLYESQGQHQPAIEDFDEAIHETPDAPFMYRARATAREGLGDRDNAEQDRVTAFRIEHPRSR